MFHLEYSPKTHIRISIIKRNTFVVDDLLVKHFFLKSNYKKKHCDYLEMNE